MKAKYPISIPCRFEGFPPLFKAIMGPQIAAPYSYGSRVLLRRTPLCGVAAGPYVDGDDLPDCAMIFSDTGSDTEFDLKLSFYGWGTFFVKASEDAYCAFEITRGIKIETGGMSKEFETTKTWETRIPADTVLTASLPIRAYAFSEFHSSFGIVYIHPDGEHLTYGDDTISGVL